MTLCCRRHLRKASPVPLLTYGGIYTCVCLRTCYGNVYKLLHKLVYTQCLIYDAFPSLISLTYSLSLSHFVLLPLHRGSQSILWCRDSNKAIEGHTGTVFWRSLSSSKYLFPPCIPFSYSLFPSLFSPCSVYEPYCLHVILGVVGLSSGKHAQEVSTALQNYFTAVNRTGAVELIFRTLLGETPFVCDTVGRI